jgi:hypothetical protein
MVLMTHEYLWLFVTLMILILIIVVACNCSCLLVGGVVVLARGLILRSRTTNNILIVYSSSSSRLHKLQHQPDDRRSYIHTMIV